MRWNAVDFVMVLMAITVCLVVLVTLYVLATQERPEHAGKSFEHIVTGLIAILSLWVGSKIPRG